MYLIKYKILGFLLILVSIAVISLSFAIFFLGLNITIGDFNISPVIVKTINFIVILLFFLYIAYIGYIMVFGSKER